MLSRRVIVIATVVRPAVFSTTSGLPTRLTVRPSSCARRSVSSRATTSISFFFERLGLGIGGRLADGLDRVLHGSAARLRHGTEQRRHVLARLLRERLRQVLSRASHGRRGAGVRAGRHRRDVARHEDDEARGRRLRAGRRDPAHDRDRRGENRLGDRPGGIEPPAGRVDSQDDERRPFRSASFGRAR